MRIPMETERLILRPFEVADVEAAVGWFGDPWSCHSLPGPDASIEQSEAWLAKYREHQITHGFCNWIILDRRSKLAIEDSASFLLSEYGWIDFGFRPAQPYWGKGLASEAASAWLQAAFCELHLKRLTAIVHPENVASIRVLAKLRFREDRRDTVLGMNSILFSRDADAHTRAEPNRKR